MAWRFVGLDQHRGRGRMKGRHHDEKRLKTAGATQPTVYEILDKNDFNKLQQLMDCWKSLQ
jgi:hypothetical protein